MPRSPLDNPADATLRSRERYRREREGLVLVQIGGDRYEVTEEVAENLRWQVIKARQP